MYDAVLPAWLLRWWCTCLAQFCGNRVFKCGGFWTDRNVIDFLVSTVVIIWCPLLTHTLPFSSLL